MGYAHYRQCGIDAARSRTLENVDLAAPAAVVYRLQEIVGSDDRYCGNLYTKDLELFFIIFLSGKQHGCHHITLRKRARLVVTLRH